MGIPVDSKGRDLSVGVDAIDLEHQVQVGLIDALGDAMRDGRETPELAKILGQVDEYSRVHFLSEQLLMRQHAYDRFDEHVQEHDRMVERLEAVRARLEGGEAVAALAELERLRVFLLTHIASKDHEFGRFLSERASVR